MILLAVLAAVGAVAYANRADLRLAIQLLGRASWGWLIPAALAILGVYACRGAVYGLTLRLMGYPAERSFLWVMAVVATSVHQLIPTGGASGYAYLTYALHRKGVSAGHASLIALVDTLSNSVAIGTLVVVSLVYLILGGLLKARGVAVSLLPAVVIVIIVAYVYSLQRDRDRFTQLVLRLTKRLPLLRGRRGMHPAVRRFLGQYYDGKTIIGERPRTFFLMVAYQYVALACDCVALYACFVTLGAFPQIWVVFMGFVLAMAGLAVIVVPGGGGSFELIMSAFFATHGVAPATAIAATLLYRLVAFWLPVVASLLLLILQRQAAATISPQRTRPAERADRPRLPSS